MPVGRRIYGFASDSTFFRFCERARSEGLSTAQAFEAIVLAYAEGMVLVRPKPPEQHAKNENGFPRSGKEPSNGKN